jgi:hypothetical protein
MPLLFELARPIDDLAEMLLRELSNKSLSVDEIYKKHSIGKPYTLKNYKEILKRLEVEEKIIANPTANNRPRDTMAGRVIITFPK